MKTRVKQAPGGPKASRSIEAIVALPRDPNQRRIRVGGRFVATLSVGELEQLGAAIGDQWTAALSERAAQFMASAKASKAALAMLARQAASAATLRARLIRKGHAPAVVDELIKQLAHDGWIDDRALGAAIASATLRKAPAGKRLLEQRMHSRGVSVEMAQAIGAQATRDQDPLAAALDLAQRSLAKSGSVDRRAALRRAAAALARRGFDDEIIEQTIDRLQGQSDTDLEPA